MKVRNRGSLVGAAFAMSAVAIAAVAPAAHAADDPTNVTVTAAEITLGAISVGDFTAVTLDGTANTTTATMAAFSIDDARGSGAGWNVTIGATEFAEWDGAAYVVDGKTLGTSRTSLGNATAAKNDATSSAVPTMTAGDYTLDAGSAVKIAAAAADGSGMGSYTITPGAVSLMVDADSYARNYRSDVTVSLTSGP